MKNDGYVLLDRVDMDTTKSKNCHVIIAKQDVITGELTFPRNRKVLCDNWEMEVDASIHPTQIFPADDEAFRKTLAKKQNEGMQICANCVKHFYAADV